MKVKRKNTCKRVVDACMTVLLLCLMAYQITGEALHEWGGVGMTALLILHHVLNRRWYAALFRGKYGAFRVFTTAVNTLLLASIALTAVSGMAMSAHAVPFLYGLLPVSLARRLHLAMSFWSFLLMGVHLGMHVPAMAAGLKWSKSVMRGIAALSAAAAGLGCLFFLRNRIPDYIFFRVPFAFFDDGKSAALVFAENLVMLISFVCLGTVCTLLIRPRKSNSPPTARS